MNRLLAAVAFAVSVQPIAARDAATQAPAADPSAARQTRDREDQTSRAVVLDLIVSDRQGRVVETLKPTDFELREDGQPRPIDEVRFVKPGKADAPAIPIASEADEQSEAKRPDARLFAIFLDEYHVGAGNSVRVREVVGQFVDETLRPSDLVVVMRPLESLLTIRMTRDREQIRQAIDRFEGRKDDYTPRDPYEVNYVAGTPERVEQIRAQVTTSALSALALHLGSLSKASRKTLIVVSEGLPRAQRRRGLEGLPTLDSVLRNANRSNVSIYAVNPSPDSNGDAAKPAEDDGLAVLASATNGRSIAGSADLVRPMRAIATDSSAYYLLIFRSAQPPDGRFHELAVSVKRPAISTRARTGYWATTPDEGLRAAVLRPRTAPALEPARRISPLIRPWFGAARGTDGNTRVTFVWEPARRVFGDPKKTPVPSRVALQALAADGRVLFDGPVLPAGPQRLTATDDAKTQAVFESRPGTLRLRMSIQDETTQNIDSDVREITVRDLSAAVVIGTPEVRRARTARDFRALESDPDAAPVASREFSRTERLMIRFPAYAPPGAPMTLTARLLNRAGQPMRELAIREGDTGSASHEIDLPLAALAAGEYLVELNARSGAGQAKDLLEIRVTN